MKRILLALLSPLVFAASGCDDSDGEFSHNPPPGQGSLIVDNQTSAKFEVYIDGEKLARVSTFDDRAFDLAPGVHRVIVDEDDGRRGDARDVDILEDRRTVLRIESDFADNDGLDIDVYIDD